MDKEQPRKLKCLKCDKPFLTTPEYRVCARCKREEDNTFDWGYEYKPHPNMGVWEKKK